MPHFALVCIVMIAVGLCLMYADHRVRIGSRSKGKKARNTGGCIEKNKNESGKKQANYVSSGEKN